MFITLSVILVLRYALKVQILHSFYPGFTRGSRGMRHVLGGVSANLAGSVNTNEI